MNAQTPTPRFDDYDLIVAIRQKAATAEAEIEAAYRFREGTAVREWHLERADTAIVELLGLINATQHEKVWQRFAEFAMPLVEVQIPGIGLRRMVDLS
jgi:hypothetical protein